MKFRKIITMLLMFVLLVGVLPAAVSAADEPISGTFGDDGVWSFTADGTMTISGTEDFSALDSDEWEDCKDSITRLIVEEGITGKISGFSFCTTLTEVTLPGTITEIGRGAFGGCTALTSINFPDGLETIGSNAFEGCTRLKSVSLPASLKTFSNRPFGGCSRLEGIWVDSANPVYASDSKGVMYTKDMTVLVEAPGALSGEYTVPASVTSIRWAAFQGCGKLTALQLPEGITAINKETFLNCSGLKEITIPVNVRAIAANSFSGCTGLDTVYMLCDQITGDDIASDAFTGVTAKVYYPRYSSVWTAAMRRSYGGDLTWMALGGPKAPTVSASNVESSGKVRLTWNAVADAASYKVYRATSKNGSYSLMKTTTATSYTNTTAAAGTRYYYYVVAVSDDGQPSDPSAVVSRTCDLARPTVTASNVASSGKVRLTWNTVEGAVSYKVYRSTTGKDGSWSLMKTTTATSYTNTTAAAGSKYYYKVRAVCDVAEAGSAYAAVSRTCDLPRPTVTASNVESSGKVRLTWNAVDGAVSYKVYRSTTGKDGSWSLMKTTTVTSYTNSTAAAGSKYYYRVQAVCSVSAANSAYTTITRTCDLARPVVTTSNVASSGKIRLTWDAVEGAVSYKVYRSATGADGTWSLMKTTGSTSYTNTTAAAGNTYYYKVKAIAANTAANSAYSAAKSRVCDYAQPQVKVSMASVSAIELSWNSVSGASGYQVYRSASASGSYSLIANVSECSWLDNTVGYGGTYYYQVVAHGNVSAATSAAGTLTAKAGPMAPALEAEIQTTITTVRINWTESPGADGYRIYIRSSSGDSWTKLAELEAGTTTYLDTQNPGRYYYCVEAYDIVGNASYTGMKSDPVRTQTLDYPVGITTDTADGQTRISWGAVEGANGYEIYCSTDVVSGWVLLETVGKETSYTHPSGSLRYYYKVRGIYQSGAITSVGPAEVSAHIITIDPGHGGIDGGTSSTYNGVQYIERNLNWKIANYCKSYLENTYEDVFVFLAREEAANPKLQERVDYAVSVGSDFLLSIHLNATGYGNARGAMALVPRGVYLPQQTEISQAAGTAILNQLAALGVSNRGFLISDKTEDTYPNGTLADSYYLIRYGVRANLPTVLMEQCYLDNSSDFYNFLSSEAKLQALGAANARGLAETLNLTAKS